MTRRHLIVVRHAQATREIGSSTDFDRPLTATGHEEARAVAAWLQEATRRPDAIVSSPAPRALTTARLLAAAWPEPPAITQELRLYEATLGTPAHLIRRFDDAWHCVVLVGHNPSLSHAVDWLLDEPAVLELPPAGLAWLELDLPHWSALAPGCARLHTLRVAATAGH